MKTFIKFAAFGVALAASSSLALADSISGTFFVQGNDTYTSNSVSFGTAAVGADHDTGTTGITGTFANYLVDGDAVVFTSPIHYTTGATETVNPAALAFTIYNSTSGTPSSSSAIFAFDVTSYTATYTACSGQSGAPCQGNSGDTFLDIIGNGVFTGVGADAALGSSAGSFDFSTQTVAGQTATDFSVSAGATPASVTPEPNSLLLLGTGLLSGAGLLSTRRRNASTIA